MTRSARSLTPVRSRPSTAQRAHANYTENLTPFLGSLLIAGLRYPIIAASLGGAWTVSRTVYAYGYAKGGPKAREA